MVSRLRPWPARFLTKSSNSRSLPEDLALPMHQRPQALPYGVLCQGERVSELRASPSLQEADTQTFHASPNSHLWM